MFIKVFVILVIFKITIAYPTVIFQKDKSVIATEPMKVSLPQNHDIIPINYSYYDVVKNRHSIRPSKAPEALDTYRLPADLIEIAATKFGLQNLYRIPSLSELSNLLGTTTREETIETIRELTKSESGIALIKAFLESSHYMDGRADKEDSIPIESDTLKPQIQTTILSETSQKDVKIIKKVLATPQKGLGLFQRIFSYLNLFYLFPENKAIQVSAMGRS